MHTQLPPAVIGTAPHTPHPTLSQQLDHHCHQTLPHNNTSPQLQAKISATAMGRSQRQPPAPLSRVAPKPLQSDLKAGSGRHPHPPSSTNTKLKHKVITIDNRISVGVVIWSCDQTRNAAIVTTYKYCGINPIFVMISPYYTQSIEQTLVSLVTNFPDLTCLVFSEYMCHNLWCCVGGLGS